MLLDACCGEIAIASSIYGVHHFLVFLRDVERASKNIYLSINKHKNMSSSTPTWLITVEDKKNTKVDEVTKSLDKYAVVSQFHIPSLRVGDIDSLMTLDEELSTRVDMMAQLTVNKIKRYQHAYR